MAQGSQYSTIITATSASQGVAFVVGSIPLRAARVHVRNAGTSSDVYFNFTTTSGATTGDFPLSAGKEVDVVATKGYYSGLSLIAAASTSSSVRCDILAYR